MKFPVLAAFAAFSSMLLSACGGANPTTVPSGVSAVNAIIPHTSTVEVIARSGGRAISGLDVVLRRNNYLTGPLIAKGKTGKAGRVRLSGNWTSGEKMCVEAQYGYHLKAVCKQPFPSSITLDF